MRELMTRIYPSIKKTFTFDQICLVLHLQFSLRMIPTRSVNDVSEYEENPFQLHLANKRPDSYSDAHTHYMIFFQYISWYYQLINKFRLILRNLSYIHLTQVLDSSTKHLNPFYIPPAAQTHQLKWCQPIITDSSATHLPISRSSHITDWVLFDTRHVRRRERWPSWRSGKRWMEVFISQSSNDETFNKKTTISIHHSHEARMSRLKNEIQSFFSPTRKLNKYVPLL